MTQTPRPSLRRAVIALAVCAPLAVAAQVALQLTYRTVGAPMSLLEYGLEGDPTTIRAWFDTLMRDGSYLLLIRAELVDLLWPVALGATIIALVRLVGTWGWDRRPRLAAFMVAWAPLFAVGPMFDLVENALSFAMLTDPDGFSDGVAAAHAVAARLKFGLAVLGATAGLTCTAIVALAPRPAHSNENEPDASVDLSPRGPAG